MPNAYTLNQKPPSYGQALSTMVDMLVGAGWTYQSSGSGANGVFAASSTVTISNASPGIVSWTTHGLTPNIPVVFTNTGGALPAEITSGVTYYVSYQSFTANSFAVSATLGGAVINTSSASTGTTTATVKKTFTTTVGQGTVTISNASPALISQTAHGLHPGDSFRLTTTGGLPTGLATGTTYFVLSTAFSADYFRVAASVEGAAINTSSAGSGTHTINPLTGWGNASAWGRIQDPGGVKEFTFQMNITAAATVRFKFSPSAKFTGGSPSVSVTPSATDEVVLLGAGTDASPTFGGWFDTGTIATPNTVIYQGVALAAAPYGFWFASQVQGTSLVGGSSPSKSSVLMLDPVTTVAEDTQPYVIYFDSGNGFSTFANAAMGRDGGITTSSLTHWVATPATLPGTGGFFAYTDTTLAVASFRTVSTALYVAYTSANTPGASSLVAGGGATIASNLLVNPFNGKNEMLPIAYLRANGSQTANSGIVVAPSLKGWSTLMRWTGVTRYSFMDTLDSKAWICVGNVWLIWDGATQPIA